MTTEKGDIVTFTAQRPAVVRGVRYRAGQTIYVLLRRDWTEDEGLGDGGPWGWGGYTSRTVAALGRTAHDPDMLRA